MDIYIEEPITSPEMLLNLPPDAGWQYQNHSGDTKQPIQADPLGNHSRLAPPVPTHDCPQNNLPPPPLSPTHSHLKTSSQYEESLSRTIQPQPHKHTI